MEKKMTVKELKETATDLQKYRAYKKIAEEDVDIDAINYFNRQIEELLIKIDNAIF